MVKRLSAVGAGALMLGATAMGALAADLSQYPAMFVKDGAFNGLFVVGESAASVDNLAMTDIAASMKAPAGSGTTTTSVEGDAWLVKSGSDVLEFSESFGPSTNGVVDFIDKDDLSALADGQLVNSQGKFTYEQFLHFDDAVINTTYAEDDDDKTALFMKIADSRQFGRYELNFLDAAESDIDASESFQLDDYEGKSIVMLGKTYDIVKAVTGGANSAKVTLTLMSGSVRDTLLSGESKEYTLGSDTYDVALTFTNSASQASFTINGEASGLLDEGETFTLANGKSLGLSDVLHNDFAGGTQSASFYLGAGKVELIDTNILDGGSSNELKVNDGTIDGAQVIITGAMLDNATSTTEDGELEIDTIEINMTSQDDYFVAAGETLQGQAELKEKDLLFTQNWDINFVGLNEVATDVIKVGPKAGEKEYELTFINVNGNKISMPLAYADSATTRRWGDQNDPLVLNRSSIRDEYYFILNDDSDEDSVTNVVQYKGASDYGESDPKIKFKVLATGETVERPITFNDGVNGATATLKLSGTTFTVTNASLGGGVNADDWNITITGGTDNLLSDSGVSGQISNFLIARGGAKIYLRQASQNVTDWLTFNISLLDADRIDDVIDVGANGVTDDLPYLVFSANITAASSELDLGSIGGITRVSPDDDTDNSYGYSANGAWVKLNSPSSSGTTADTVEIDWPQEERYVKAYVTSGATTTSSTTSGGPTVPVEVVDATRLDSEVSSASAQNLIVVGGPCVNTVAAELLGSPQPCTTGFKPGVGRVKLITHANGNVAMLVAGYSGADTRLTGRVVAQMPEKLTGDEVEVSGSSLATVQVSAPSPVVVAEAPVVEAPVAE